MIENNNNNSNTNNNNNNIKKSNNNLNFIKMIEDIKEEKLKRYLDGDVENLKKVQHLYQDISQKMIAQQDECRSELELWRDESIQFEKSIPTPEDEEEHIEKINDLENIKCQLIEENTKVEEAINYFEDELSLIRSKKEQLIFKENQLSIENTHLIPDKEYLYSLYTSITGIKWSNLNNQNNNEQLQQQPLQREQQHTQPHIQSQFIKGVIFDTQSFGNQQNSGQQIKPFSIDRNQYTNDFDIVNKIWDLLD